MSNEEKITTFLDLGYTREVLPVKRTLSSQKTQPARTGWIEELLVRDPGRIPLFFIDRSRGRPITSSGGSSAVTRAF